METSRHEPGLARQLAARVRGSAGALLRRATDWAKDVVAPHSRRGIGFWVVTALLGLVLPAPVAVVVVAARLRRPGGASVR